MPESTHYMSSTASSRAPTRHPARDANDRKRMGDRTRLSSLDPAAIPGHVDFHEIVLDPLDPVMFKAVRAMKRLRSEFTISHPERRRFTWREHCIE